MQLGMIGLGRMGGAMVERIMATSCHQVVAYDRDPEAVERVALVGAAGADSLRKLVYLLPPPCVVWVMLPAGAPTRDTICELSEILQDGDLVIDGGNSHYAEAGEHASLLGRKGVGFMTVGVSGGVHGLANGYGLMVGGSATHVERMMPIFEALAPDKYGFVHAGEAPGAGHFVKMVHNGIEYALMQAYAEGFELLKVASDIVDDPAQIFESWRDGSVVRSWLLDLLSNELMANPCLDGRDGAVGDSGEGRWTVQAAADRGVPVPTISAALAVRLMSQREGNSPTRRALNGMRWQFGRHTQANTPKL